MTMNTRNLFLVALLVLACEVSGTFKDCGVQRCSDMFETSKTRVTPMATYKFCTLVQMYKQCLDAIDRGCRGHITYHSMQTSVKQYHTQYDCQTIIRDHHESDMDEDSYSSHPIHKSNARKLPEECIYRDLHPQFENRHCSLFGDPHLRTFYNEFSTCTLEGTWPLVDNNYFTIQVTNSPVSNGLKATAPTEVTVVVHAYNNCTQSKVYRAVVSEPLPFSFTDGTVSRASQSTRIHFAKNNPKAVVIMLRHAATRIVIRHVEMHLTVAIRAPRDISQLGEAFSNELCNAGCPVKETIDHKKMIDNPAENGLNLKSGGFRPQSVQEICRKNLSGIYYEACLFDLLATGDPSFAEAARLANQDAKDMLKNQHLNRTSLRATSLFVYSGTAGSKANVSLLSQTLVTLLALSQFVRHLLL